MALTKMDIADIISAKTGTNKKESLDDIELLLTFIKEVLQSGENLKISGFGNFIVKEKAPRKGRNPQTGESIVLPGRRIVNYRVSAILKNAINAGK